MSNQRQKMTLTELKNILKEFNLEFREGKYHHEARITSKIFRHGYGPLLIIEGEEHHDSHGFYCTPVEENNFQIRCYFYIEPERYDPPYWIPSYHFQNWGIKTNSELKERWLRSMLTLVLRKIDNIETGKIKYPPKKPCWGDLKVRYEDTTK